MNLGIMEDELKQFGHFKTRVLDISEREINSKTDIRISWDTTRKGQKVTHVTFKIQQFSTEDFKETAVDEFHQELLRFGLLEEKSLEFIKNYDLDYLNGKLNSVKAKMSENGLAIENPVGFFIASVEKDYQEKEKIRIPVRKKDIKKTKGLGTSDELLELQKQLENAIRGQESTYAKQQDTLMSAFKAEEEKIREKIARIEGKLKKRSEKA
jgi:plasmid replication initiation protein